jgi:hypothetical protein
VNRGGGGNPKTQVPNLKEFPISNNQRGADVMHLGIGNLGFGIYLGFGFWVLGFKAPSVTDSRG